MAFTAENVTERQIAKTIETSGRWLAGASPRPSVRERRLSVEVAQS